MRRLGRWESTSDGVRYEGASVRWRKARRKGAKAFKNLGNVATFTSDCILVSGAGSGGRIWVMTGNGGGECKRVRVALRGRRVSKGRLGGRRLISLFKEWGQRGGLGREGFCWLLCWSLKSM